MILPEQLETTAGGTVERIEGIDAVDCEPGDRLYAQVRKLDILLQVQAVNQEEYSVICELLFKNQRGVAYTSYGYITIHPCIRITSSLFTRSFDDWEQGRIDVDTLNTLRRGQIKTGSLWLVKRPKE